MDPKAIVLVMKEVGVWVSAISDWSSKNKDKEKAALDKLLLALSETMIHLGKTPKVSDNSPPVTDERIARIWREAASEVQPYNSELSKCCNAKGLYWGNPSYFTVQEISEMNIKISDIQSYVNKAIQNV